MSFHLDRNPGPLGSSATLPGVDGSWFPLGTATTSGEGNAAGQVQANGWAAGSYRILAYAAATASCPVGSGAETLAVGEARKVAFVRGTGWTRAGGRTDFRVSVATGENGSNVRGWIAVSNGMRWKLVGAPTSVTIRACDEGQCADVSGTGRLYERSRSESRRGDGRRDRQRWVLRSRDAQFTLHLVDRGSRRRDRDRFGIAFAAPELAGLRGTTGNDTASVRRGFVEIRGVR